MNLHKHIAMSPTMPPSLMTNADVGDYVLTEMERAMYRTLIVGGESSFVQRKLAPRLRRHFLRVVAHWPWKRAPGAFPEAIDVLFVCTDMLGHSLSNAAVEEARKRGIPIIMGGRKHALNLEKLEAAGFPEHPLLAAQKPLVSEKRARRVSEEAAPSVTAALPPLPVEEPDTVPEQTVTHTHAPEPTSTLTPEPTMPATAPATPNLPPFPTLTRDERALALLLAAEPGLSNTRALERMGDEWNYGKMSVAGAKVRRTLGISIPRNAKSDMHVERAVYERGCHALGVEPVPPGGYQRERKLKTFSSAHRVPPSFSTVAAEEVATVPTASVPAHLIAAYEQEQQVRRETTAAPVAPAAPTEVGTTVEALRLLLEAMRAEHVASITVNDDGTVSMQRRVVVISNLVL